MILKNIYPAIFFNRNNRFVGIGELQGKKIQFHIGDTGRLTELLYSGNQILVQKLTPNPDRKYNFRLIGAKNSQNQWILVNSLLHSQLVENFLQKQNLNYQKEVKLQDGSRIDFLLNGKVWVEIKGCSLAIAYTGYFPDAPTSRGAKHLQHLIELLNQGQETQIWFLMANRVKYFSPNYETDPYFSILFEKFLKAGGKVKFLNIVFKFDKDKNEVKIWLEENDKVKIRI